MISGKQLAQHADDNLTRIADGKHLGQGLVVGLDDRGENLVQLYWALDQGRILKHNGNGRIFAEFIDPEKNKNASLYRYNVMREATRGSFTYAVVSSGNQTDIVTEGLAENINMKKSLRHLEYEPRSLEFVPRITAECHWEKDRPIIKMSALRKSLFSFACDRTSIEINGMGTGFGYGMTTHLDEPFLLPFRGSMSEIATMYWEELNLKNKKVSLVMKIIPRKYCSQIFLINQ